MLSKEAARGKVCGTSQSLNSPRGSSENIAAPGLWDGKMGNHITCYVISQIPAQLRGYIFCIQ